MPLYRRIARRGFSNYRFKVEYVVINLGEIDSRYESGQTVSLETLIDHRLIRKNHRFVKILGDGDLKKKLDIVGLKVSKPARAKIYAAGGAIDGVVEENVTVSDVVASAIEAPDIEAVTEETVPDAGPKTDAAPKKTSPSKKTPAAKKTSASQKTIPSQKTIAPKKTTVSKKTASPTKSVPKVVAKNGEESNKTDESDK